MVGAFRPESAYSATVGFAALKRPERQEISIG